MPMKFLVRLRRDLAVNKVIRASERLNELHALRDGLVQELQPEEHAEVCADIDSYEARKNSALTYLKETA